MKTGDKVLLGLVAAAAYILVKYGWDAWWAAGLVIYLPMQAIFGYLGLRNEWIQKGREMERQENS
jgi:hypothetical protein